MPHQRVREETKKQSEDTCTPEYTYIFLLSQTLQTRWVYTTYLGTLGEAGIHLWKPEIVAGRKPQATGRRAFANRHFSAGLSVSRFHEDRPTRYILNIYRGIAPSQDMRIYMWWSEPQYARTRSTCRMVVCAPFLFMTQWCRLPSHPVKVSQAMNQR